MEEIFLNNAKRLLARLEEHEYDALILTSESNLLYVTGIRSPTGAIILSNNCPWTIITSVLDYSRIAKQAPKEYEIRVAYRGENESLESTIPKNILIKDSLYNAVSSIIKSCNIKRPAADIKMTSYAIGELLKQKIEGLQDFSKEISSVRVKKTNDEIALISKAADIADNALRRLIDNIHEGVSEAELSGILYKELAIQGSWGEAFPNIIAFYANTAYPHHTPTLAKLTIPGPILIDWGAVYNGYRSDSTRTFWWGAPNTTFRKHYEILLEAQETAIDSIYAGAEAREPDTKARQVLARHGLEKYFIHGLGHGVGVDIHEEPYLRPGSKTILEKNMVVTIEPGIYIDGLYGIRIEDLGVVTSNGIKLLTRFSRHLIEL